VDPDASPSDPTRPSPTPPGTRPPPVAPARPAPTRELPAAPGPAPTRELTAPVDAPVGSFGPYRLDATIARSASATVIREYDTSQVECDVEI
jgi:hypothetical protein